MRKIYPPKHIHATDGGMSMSPEEVRCLYDPFCDTNEILGSLDAASPVPDADMLFGPPGMGSPRGLSNDGMEDCWADPSPKSPNVVYSAPVQEPLAAPASGTSSKIQRTDGMTDVSKARATQFNAESTTAALKSSKVVYSAPVQEPLAAPASDTSSKIQRTDGMADVSKARATQFNTESITTALRGTSVREANTLGVTVFETIAYTTGSLRFVDIVAKAIDSLSSSELMDSDDHTKLFTALGRTFANLPDMTPHKFNAALTTITNNARGMVKTKNDTADVFDTKPLRDPSHFLSTPRATSGVFVRPGMRLKANSTVVEYLGAKTSAKEVDNMRKNDARRKHTIGVGARGYHLVPAMDGRFASRDNFAARVRDCGKDGVANCALVESGDEKLWLVVLDEAIVGGRELVLEFADDGLD
jgi:hypothetical protein